MHILMYISLYFFYDYSIGDLSSRSQHEHLYSIKGKQKISDLISGELPNEIVKVKLWFKNYLFLQLIF